MQDYTQIIHFRPEGTLLWLMSLGFFLPLGLVAYFLLASIPLHPLLMISLPSLALFFLITSLFLIFQIHHFEKQISLMLSLGIDLLLILNQDGLIEEANYTASSLLHYQPEELKGKSLLDLMEEKAKERGRKMLRQMSQPKALLRYQRLALIGKNKEKVWIILNVLPYRQHGREKHICLGREITSQRKLEKKAAYYKGLVNGIMKAVTEGIIIYSPKGQVLKINQSHLNLFQTESLDEKISSFDDQFGQDHSLKNHHQRISPGSIKQAKDANGNFLYYLINQHEVKNAKGKPISIIQCEQEITTEYLLYELFLHRSQEKEIKNLISPLAHELKNPLTIIKGWADLLRIKYPEEDWVKEILHQTMFLNNTLSSFLGTRRGRSQRYNRVNLEQVIEETIKFLTDKGYIQGFQIKRQYSVSNCLIEGNPAYFQLAVALVLNTIRKSIKAKSKKNEENPVEGNSVTIILDKGHEGTEIFCDFHLSFPFDHDVQFKVEAMMASMMKEREPYSPHLGPLEINQDQPINGNWRLRIPLQTEKSFTILSAEN